MASGGGDDFQDIAELEEAQSQLEEIEAELQRLSLSAVEPAMRDSLMNKLRQVRLDLFERQGELEESGIPRRTFQAPPVESRRKAKRAQSAHFADHGSRGRQANIYDTEDAAPVLQQRRASSAKLRSAGSGSFAPLSKGRKSSAPRRPIAMDMMKFVDTTRPPTASSRRSGDTRTRVNNSAFSALPASRPGPGPAEYYPDYRKRAVMKRTPVASFGKEDRMKHLAGETSVKTEGRQGPGPKYKPSLVQTKQRNSVTAIGRENRLGSSISA